jgi:hypothetical protein
LKKVLFILKERVMHGPGMSNGLSNSCRFVVDMLNEQGIEAKVIEVVDNNCIDREVTRFKPTHVIVEALWVVPEKFKVLHTLHPEVKWIVRGHSEVPFLAVEGVALDWVCRYVQIPSVSVAFNSFPALYDIRSIVQCATGLKGKHLEDKVIYLPNYYPWNNRPTKRSKKEEDKYVDVACFGAIRPLKNQLVQAVAAMKYAEIKGKTLRFHVNGTRCEQGGDNVLRNIKSLFTHTKHELVEHGWLNHQDFLEVLSQMDIGMQVSFSETFNIVAADMVVTGLPIVASTEIPWLSSWCQAEPTNSEDILLKMLKANDWRLNLALRVLNLRGLKHYCIESKRQWVTYLQSTEGVGHAIV